MCEVKIGNFLYTHNSLGEWVYKSIPTTDLKFKNPHYQDIPQYKVIDQVEQKQKKDYDLMLEQSIKEINKFLKDVNS